MEKNSLSRRGFLKTSSLALPLSTALPMSMAAVPQTVTTSASRRKTYFDKGTRLSISMWDFSWLFANCPGGAYEDLERRVAEAAERGYNTLRVDCFPGRFLEGESRFEKNWDPAVNAPQWGEDGWIYFGRGWGGGKITGPHLAEPVDLPGSDFRIRPDGRAIEPVTGATHTFGFAMTESGDRFTVNTTIDRKSTRLNSSHEFVSRMPSSA